MGSEMGIENDWGNLSLAGFYAPVSFVADVAEEDLSTMSQDCFRLTLKEVLKSGIK